ncbi:MAG: DUF2993 domain-containing protein [Synergistaceae bacterium]|jgi:hypothetical protein|uniref:DUF2993 domain-containing protein n=1 Tax=Aminivibrio sp. TaxID=1872489 RepID=UPI0016B7BAAA|nr:DUF2993 domain-containing protein [Synergistaceae bacterium]NCC56706.1 DUF2993 domain-containing protein [Synergistales bacterium]MDD3689778.1 DUF2993 domain-containing protein [Synergistaceae bacterium]MDD4020289.1 DUF2993 domain-containing protein [Synergistaceae bacterium]MDD4612652.1 DUF2993 domain-containing protein [Synergistaceae bacterium]
MYVKKYITWVFVPAAILLLFIFSAASPLWAETRGKKLLDHFVKEFSPEEITMIIDEEPNEKGYVRDIFLDISGCSIGGVRIDSLTLRAMGVQMNAPEEWDREGLDAKEILNVHALARILEKDLNNNLLSKEFGDDDHWHDLQVDMRPEGIYARGNYLVTVLFRLDILIEIFSKFKIVDRKEVWLDDYTLKVNRVDVPQFITDKAVREIQPLLDLGKFVFPLRLHSISYDENSLAISSRVLPESFEGIVYRYSGKK